MIMRYIIFSIGAMIGVGCFRKSKILKNEIGDVSLRDTQL